MLSSDALRRCLKQAELRKSPDLVPRTGEEAEKLRSVTVYFELDGAQYLFDAVRGDDVLARKLRGQQYRDKVELSIYDVWRSKPHIIQYWGLQSFEFDTWAGFSRERAFHLSALQAWMKKMRLELKDRRLQSRKAISIERFQLIRIVGDLSGRGVGRPGQGAIATELLGKQWERYQANLAPFNQMRRMLEALVELGELSSRNHTYAVTGKGVAALSQYEEEERKHKEAIALQKKIAWLTIVMALAALLQAKVIEFPPLLKFAAWPWS